MATDSAKVIETIYDLSGRVGTAPGITAAIALPDAPKGPVNKPFLVTNVDTLLDIYTTDGTVKPSYNMAFFEAQAYLERANKLYCIRPDVGQLYGGSVIPKSAAGAQWKAATALVADAIIKPSDLPALRLSSTGYAVGQMMRPTADAKFKFKCVTAGITSSTVDDEFDNVTAAGQQVNDGTVIWQAEAINHPTNFVFKVVQAGTTGATEPVWPTEAPQEDITDGSVKYQAVATAQAAGLEEGIRDPELDDVFGESDNVLFIHGKYPGADNNDIAYRIYNYETYPDIVLEEDAFVIEVYKRGTGVKLESHVCSTDINKKDGYNQSIFVETVLEASKYIGAVVNETMLGKKPIDVEQLTYLTGGSDGNLCTDANMVLAIDKINNRNTYPIKLLLDGSWTTVTYHKKLNAIAKSRQDCLALLSTPYSTENTTDFMNQIIDYRKNRLNLNSYWSALYTPHLEMYDQYNDRYLWVGPSSSAAATISEIATNFQPWFPPAGLNRGILDSVSNVKIRFDEPQMDFLCNNQINPVAFFSGQGIVIWGQQTLYSRPSALQDLNVMLLIITIMPEIGKALKYYLFEFNDSDTRGLIKTMVDDYMKPVKANKGVYDWECSVHATDEDVDNGLLYVDLLIKPRKAINTIRFRVVPVKTGASFSTALEILGAE